jgi:hypothetical protein
MRKLHVLIQFEFSIGTYLMIAGEIMKAEDSKFPATRKLRALLAGTVRLSQDSR